MMLTIPSNKPQIHYTMCKMEKNPTLHNRYIVIITGFRTPNQNYFFFFLPNCSASNFLQILFFSCILLAEKKKKKKRHFPGSLLIMWWAKVCNTNLQFWTWGFSYEWGNTA